MKRYAIIKNADSRRQLEAYLPGNYEIIFEYTSADDSRKPLCFVIAGRDDAGWTLDDYVTPRLASGLIWATEIDLSHPIMKSVKIEEKAKRFDAHTDWLRKEGSA